MSFQLSKRRYPVREKAAVAWQAAYLLTFDAAAEYSMILRPFSGFMIISCLNREKPWTGKQTLF